MSSRSRQMYESAGSTLVLGVLGYWLFDGQALGLNVLLWTAALCGTVVAMVLRWRDAWAVRECVPLLGAFLLGAAMLVRTAPGLQFTLTIGILAFLLLTVQQTQTHAIHPVLRAGLGRLRLPRVLYASWLRLIPDVFRFDFKTLDTSGVSRHGPAALRGIAIATPVLIFFGLLLGSADATFQNLLVSHLMVDVSATWSLGFYTLFLGFIAAGLLRGVLFALDLPDPDRDRSGIGALETGIVLGLVSLLFALYVGVQVPYFFGGLETVLSTRDLTVAEYARQGFFELSVVAGGSLVLLLSLKARLAPAARAGRIFRIGAASLLVLLLVMLSSAGLRMDVYVSEFGLTTMRLYVSVFLLWLGVGFGWFGWTVLRDRDRRFVTGMAVFAFVLVVAMVAVNPARLVVKANADRAARTGTFDHAYARSLGPDAVPALIAVLPALPQEDAAGIAGHMLCTYSEGSIEHEAAPAWVSWTWSRHRAGRLVTEREADLWLYASLDALNCFRPGAY